MRWRMHCLQCNSRASALRLFLENCSSVLKAPQFVQRLISCGVPGPRRSTELSNGRLMVLIALSTNHYRTYVLCKSSFIAPALPQNFVDRAEAVCLKTNPTQGNHDEAVPQSNRHKLAPS